jgi:hypothetical protein
LTPSEVFAQSKGIVGGMRSEAVTASIKVHKLRGNISVLEGSGGNVAVLTGPDGKVLIDAWHHRLTSAHPGGSVEPQQRSDPAADQHSLALRSC